MIPQPDAFPEARREAGLDRPQPARERLSHAAWLLSRYWLSKDWPVAWGALIALICFSFGGIYVAVWANGWQQQFYDSIQNRAGGLFLSLLTSFAIILSTQILLSVGNTALLQWLGIRWRRFLTDRYLGRWFARDRYFEIERLQLIDNPDQRIAVDLAALTGVGGVSILTNLLGLLSSVVGSISFSILLLQTAEPIHLAAFGYHLDVPGDLVWYGWLYALLGAMFIAWIGRPYVRRSMRAQHYEADFRAALLHVRRNGEQIALAGAQPAERRNLAGAFDRIQANYHRFILANIGLNIGQNIYERIGSLLPLFLTVPRFFAGALSFGQVMAAKNAFEQLTGSLSYFVQAYGQIGAQIANINRLKALDDAIGHERPRGIAFRSGAAPDGVALAIEGLELRRPHGAPLFSLPEWVVRPGERWLVEGPSGIGKSTLMRAIVGLWPDGQGSIALSDRELVMVVPQRLYLPLGTLKDTICFPDPAERHGDAAIRALLDSVRLGEHATDLHAVRMWQDELSPGEQQRIALARILLHQPDILILDEATSALDPFGARHFHETLSKALPQITLVAVVHDPRLTPYFTHRLAIIDRLAVPAPIECQS